MAEPAEDLDLLIDEYLDNRLESDARAQFERRLNAEPELRQRLESATRSVDMVQQALGWVTPDDEFDSRINSKIVDITQSGQNLRPAFAAHERSLTSEDPDAKLFSDPEASRENRRLVMLGLVAVVLFLLAAAAIVYAIVEGVQPAQK